MQACPRCGRENADDAKFCSACAHELSAPSPGRESRKTVTVVFCDVTGSTALGERTDPESLRRVMTRYFEAMRSVLESHGASVEKFIGDAVMAVFGVPRVHEDDALRAVRAAVDMRSALAELNADLARDHGMTIQVRIGVNTGEVVAGDPSAGHNVVTGDAVNTAARLEQAAGAGEILIGDATYSLVRDAVVVEEVDPLDLKGKAALVDARRLLEVRAGVEGHARRMDSPMVGRERPLRLLRETFDGVTADRACALFTVMGPAGIGKTRLTGEFLGGLDASVGARPNVLSGRCLPYGEGITFWPISEMLVGAAGISDVDTPELVVDRIRASLEPAPDAERVATHLAALIGAHAHIIEVEPAWAVRRLFETLASAEPVIAYFDDIHWAEPGLLDVIEHVADFSRDSPILVLCTARPEFFDRRPSWGGGKLRATAVYLEPLDERESEELIGNLLSHPSLSTEIRQRIREAAQGNPLFVEEMIQMLLDDGSIVEKDEGWVTTIDLTTVHIPPAISALLAARLDRLPSDEREGIEAASVGGEVFERAAVREIAHRPAADSDALLSALVRKDLIVPSRSDLGGEEAFRFRHLLIRDAAYGGIPKERRAELHEAFAGWLETAAGERATEVDEVLGYHLEQAHAFRGELGATVGLEVLAARAANALGRAGLRARTRGDLPGTVNLLSRAARLQLPGEERIRMLIDLTSAASEVLDERTASWAADEGVADARVLGDEALLARAQVARALWRVYRHDEWDEAKAVADAAIEVLERHGDHRGLAEAWLVLAWNAGGRGGTYGRGTAAAEVSAEHARAAGDRIAELLALSMQVGWTTWGPRPVNEAISFCETLLPLVDDSRSMHAEITLARAVAEAMRGNIDDARAGYAAGIEVFKDLGQRLSVAFATQEGWLVEWLAGDYAGAESTMRGGIAILEERGKHALIPLHRAMMGQAICAQERFQEADEIARETEMIANDPEDLSTQSIWRRIRALAASARGEFDEADRLSREAVEIAERTDGLFDHAWTLIERAQLLREAGRGAEAGRVLEEAAAIAERKGDLVTAARARGQRCPKGEERDRR